MASLSQAKTLGGVGSILILLTVVPGIGFVLSLVGFLLVLVAVKIISDHVADEAIFRNILIAVMLVIIANVTAVLLFLLLLPQFFTLDPTRPPNPADLFAPEVVVTLFGIMLVGWVFLLVSALFLRRSFESVADRLDVPMFITVALLFLLGAATFIIFVGFIILFVAEFLQIVAFFSIPEEIDAAGPASSPPPIG